MVSNMKKMIIYFDSGTTNSRGYLMAADGTVLDSQKCTVGSRDSAITGSNKVVIDALYGIYTTLLERNGASDADVERIYASGMVTCPYGLCEVPHVNVPVTVEEFAKSIYAFYEEQRFRREIRLIRGLRTLADSASQINNLRGEEIEVIGALPKLKHCFGEREVAVIMPGSHTHTLLVKNGVIEDLLANFTGELYSAIRRGTILAPVLDVEVDEFDADSIKLGVENLRKYGFTRALYICHAMRLFDDGTTVSRASYAEGVILGGMCQSLDWCKEERWKDLQDLVIIADAVTADIYSKVLANCLHDFTVHTMVIDKDWIPAVEGIRVLMKAEGR